MTRLAGKGALGTGNGVGSNAMFYNPHGIAVSTSGTVYVADRNNNRIRMISPTGNDTLP